MQTAELPTNPTLLYFPRVGHAIYQDRPDIYTQAVKSFLLDRPLLLQPWEGDGQ
jgi:pimeloyl-ACP methyl ester carboxylesterase